MANSVGKRSSQSFLRLSVGWTGPPPLPRPIWPLSGCVSESLLRVERLVNAADGSSARGGRAQCHLASRPHAARHSIDQSGWRSRQALAHRRDRRSSCPILKGGWAVGRRDAAVFPKPILPRWISNQRFTVVSRALKLRIFLRVALGEPNEFDYELFGLPANSAAAWTCGKLAKRTGTRLSRRPVMASGLEPIGALRAF